jgi:hypothetical protein
MPLTPAQIAAYVEEAWLDVSMEFARCLGETPEGDVLKKAREIFDNTVKNAIENHGVEWEEPIRSYALRHVCKIAKEAQRCRGCGGKDLDDDLEDVAKDVFDKANESCKRLEQREIVSADKVGVLCERA